ncbi:MAG: aminotransferase class V-fold PLP-dependent enzyme [Thermoleophilia bacterium]|nr:aminotransferase class V-fold PLP-dependent enzyme [Thermoleophilia bacterium]MDQ3857672.1 aminotransferase class V-fold PLP-dependent enzyme [Actinomycetota bacterium]
MDLSAVRAELPVLERYAYLNAGTFGPLPRRTVETMVSHESERLAEGRFGRAFFESAMGERQLLRDAFARLLGAETSSIAFTTSTTEACNAVVAGLRLVPGDEVVTTDAEHPGLRGALRAWRLDVREAPVSRAPASEALALVQRELTPRTRLVALSHVTWTTGQVLPVAELATRGAPVLVDGAQSAGAIPVDVGSLGVDFYTASGQKWLLGPDATGCLYVRPDWIERLAMTYPSYLSWEDVAELVPWPDARRFESVFTPTASVAGLSASLAFAEEVGEERFTVARLVAERCRELVGERAEVVTEPGQATLVSFRPWDPPDEVVARLEGRGVVVRDLPGTGWVRASCGFWTSDDDLERLAAGL